MDVEWMASELARGLGIRRADVPVDGMPACAVACDPVRGRVTVNGAGWQIVVSRNGERFAVMYDGDFDLIAARICAHVARLDALLAELSSDERRLLWAVRQRLAPEGRLSAP